MTHSLFFLSLFFFVTMQRSIDSLFWRLSAAANKCFLLSIVVLPNRVHIYFLLSKNVMASFRLRTQQTKLVDVVAVTADSPGSNRKAVKKSRLAFPVLSDDDEGSWMLAYQLKSPTRFFEQTAFLIEPDLGTVRLIQRTRRLRAIYSTKYIMFFLCNAVLTFG